MAGNQEKTGPISINAAAFDLEGTIVDLEPLHHESHLHAAAKFGIKLSEEEAISQLPHFIGGPDEQVAAEIAALSPSHVTQEDVLRTKQELFRQLFANINRIPVRPGCLAFCKWISSKGISVAVGTTTTREFAQMLLDRAGFSEFFQNLNLVAREDVAFPKPAPDVYVKTAQLSRVLPRQQLVFEDSPVGVKAAVLAGSHVVALPTVRNETLASRLTSEGAEAIFTSWEQPDLRTFVARMI